ncbi:MAG: PadR family transcriptional regulator [Acidimicrobiia bacterium]
MALNTTRLLVLGVTRIFQPVHGYFVRRELLSWHADEWARINPGSIYNALRSLERAGFVTEVATDAEGNRPAKTTYRLTADGESEFRILLRDHLWDIDSSDPTSLRAGLSFMWALPREEVVAAMDHRANALEGLGNAQRFTRQEYTTHPDRPDHVVEVFLLEEARLESERHWAIDFAQRLRSGAYRFAGEGDDHADPNTV